VPRLFFQGPTGRRTTHAPSPASHSVLAPSSSWMPGAGSGAGRNSSRLTRRAVCKRTVACLSPAPRTSSSSGVAPPASSSRASVRRSGHRASSSRPLDSRRLPASSANWRPSTATRCRNRPLSMKRTGKKKASCGGSPRPTHWYDLPPRTRRASSLPAGRARMASGPRSIADRRSIAGWKRPACRSRSDFVSSATPMDPLCRHRMGAGAGDVMSR